MIVWILLLLLFLGIYLFLTKNFNYWRIRKVAFEDPRLLVGSIWPIVSRQKSLGEYLRDVYEKHPEQPYVGIFLGGSPCLLVRDFDLARNILNRDIGNFALRIVQFEEKREPVLSKALFVLGSSRWKNARQGATPGFTSLKLKQYFNDMIPIVKDMHQRIKANPEQDVMTLSWCFTVDAINRPLFGLHSESLLNPNDELLNLSKELYKTDFMTVLAKFMLFAEPTMYSALGLKAFPNKTVETIKKLTRKVMTSLDNGGPKPKNIMTLLHNLLTKETAKPGEEPFGYDEDAVVAQVFTFLVAGTDTLSSTMTYCLYELAKHPEMQEKLRQEVLAEFPGGLESMNYDKVTSLKYLYQIILETSRLHPSFPFVDRICTKDYIIPGTDITINKGVYVFIAMWGLHMDENYWENPKQFNPDRFEDLNVVNSKPYLPFGNGIRHCIGMKFAIQEMQLFIAGLVAQWRWKLSPSDTGSFKLNTLTYTNMPDRPLKIIFEPLS